MANAVEGAPGVAERIRGSRIQPRSDSAEVRRHERRYSRSTGVVALLLCAVGFVGVSLGAIPIRFDWPGPGRLALEVALVVALFDLYFYGLHRLLHVGPLFRRVHAVHHRATAPSALTAVVFHPAESLALLGFFPVLAWLVPLHAASLAIGGTLLGAWIVLAHCGHEMFPRWWHETPLLAWLVTPLVHDQHHTSARRNFGAATSIPDRVFGTYALDVDAFYQREAASATRDA